MPDLRLEEKCLVETRKTKVIFVQFHVFIVGFVTMSDLNF